MEQTSRFALPLLAPGQSQKEFFHNEALERIAFLLCPVVDGQPQANPPAYPEAGTCYLIATGAVGDWEGNDGTIACFTAGGWRFVAPVEGLGVVERASGEQWHWRSGAWEAGIVRAQEVRISGQKVLHRRQPAIAAPSGGNVVDTENRAAVMAILAALRAHGLID
jgi:hypothetical protein